MNTVYGRDGNVYETEIRGMNSGSFIQSELVKNEANQIELQYNDYKNQKFNELVKENKQLKEKINKLELLIESLELGVTLNQEQEELLDKILFGGDSNE